MRKRDIPWKNVCLASILAQHAALSAVAHVCLCLCLHSAPLALFTTIISGGGSADLITQEIAKQWGTFSIHQYSKETEIPWQSRHKASKISQTAVCKGITTPVKQSDNFYIVRCNIMTWSLLFLQQLSFYHQSLKCSLLHHQNAEMWVTV